MTFPEIVKNKAALSLCRQFFGRRSSDCDTTGLAPWRVH